MDEEDFLFIRETGGETGARSQMAAVRSRIKSHVMNRVFRQKRSPKPDRSRIRRLESKDMSESSSSSQISNHAHRVKSLVSANTGYRQWASGETKTPRPPGFTAGVEDMIRVAGLPIELGTADSKFILHHFLQTHSPLMCTIASETGWLQYAIEDNALFNSTLYYWALLNHKHLPVKYQSQESLIRLKGLAISKITSRLSPMNGNGVDDAVIASVACLANVNFKVGNLGEARTHFQGLTAMIRARRGIQNLGYRGLISRLSKATDSCNAQLSNTTLSFEESTGLPQNLDIMSPLNFSFAAITDQLREITSELIEAPRLTRSIEDRVRLGQLLLASDRKLVKYIRNAAPRISTVVATAGLLYSHVLLRGMEVSAALVKACANQLKDAIISAYDLRDDFFDQNPLTLA